MRACVRACVRVCVCARVCVWLSACLRVLGEGILFYVYLCNFSKCSGGWDGKVVEGSTGVAEGGGWGGVGGWKIVS